MQERGVVSLNRRLLLVASLVLLAFLGATGAALENAFRESLEQAQRDRLQGALYTLLAAADLRDGRLEVPAELPEARLRTPGSGLYAQVVGANGTGWRSPSQLGREWSADWRLPPGETRFYSDRLDGEWVAALGYGLSWEEADGREAVFTVHVAEDAALLTEQLVAFRGDLWGWLGAAAVFLLLAQLAVLQWSLRPLRTVADDLHAIEQGRADFLQGRYPAEILGLTRGLNALLKSERNRATRYRDTLANLAHSLKTPLAVLRGALETTAPPEALEQIARIDAAVEYQLKKAAATQEVLAAPLAVVPVLQRLLTALATAHRDRPLRTDLHAEGEALFYGPEGDLMELAGNLLDNAFKWGRQGLRVTVAALPAGPAQRPGLSLTIEDDGPGLPEARAEQLLRRGARADEQVPGHGIGLAVVADLVAAYHGQLRIDRGELGGARFHVQLPGT